MVLGRRGVGLQGLGVWGTSPCRNPGRKLGGGLRPARV